VRPPIDSVRTLYLTIVASGAIAIVILALGLVEFVRYEPQVQASGSQALIVGVYRYDATSHTTFGPDQGSFGRTQTFAAVVDWSKLAGDITVDARWYDSFEDVVGRVGPGTAAQLTGMTTVPVMAPVGFQHNLPGHYIFVVERLQGGEPVEVLARRIVLVARS